ncbi:MAG: DUF6049 family protein [Mycobacteriales bacterium]
MSRTASTARHRPGRLVAALLLGTAVAAGALTGAARAGPAAAVVATDEVAAVTIGSVAPVSVTTGQTLTLAGSVRNTGTAPLRGLRVLVGVGSPPSGRGALVRAFDQTPRLERVLTDCGTCTAAALAPTASATWSVSIPLGSQLDRSTVSIYPLIVRIDSVAGSAGRASTWLPYFPGGVAAPVHVSWLWPLDLPPVVGATGAIRDPSFPASLATSGKVGSMLAESTAPATTTPQGDQPGFAPVTYAVEPSLLAAAAATAQNGWRRTGDTDATASRPADPASATFLSALRTATAGRGVVALPYADPDAAALTHNGLSLDLTTAVGTGRTDVAAALPRAEVLSGVGWVPGTAVDQPTLDTYAAAGDTALVLPGGQLTTPSDAFPPTRTAVTTLPTRGPTVTGLVTDPDVEALLATGGHDQPTPRMAAQRLLALLASIVAEAPNRQGAARDVVLALPRGVTPDSAWAADVLGDTGSVSWLRAVPLGQVQHDPPAERTELAAYPAGARNDELPASALTGGTGSVTAVRAVVDDAASMLTGASLVRPLYQALSASESYAWRADRDGGQQLRAGAQQVADQILGQVRVATAATVTLASGRASIPVTVDNGIDQPVNVRLNLRATDRTKIGAVAQLVTVQANRKLRVLIPASSRRAGTFRATISLSTPSGRELTAVPITVHSRAYGRLTLGITFGALAVLVVALLIRISRRIALRRTR